MTGIHLLASSKPLTMPEEIVSYMDSDMYDPDRGFGVYYSEIWQGVGEKIFSMPYIYEVGGVGNDYFFVYLKKYMELGDTLELYEIPVQQYAEQYINQMQENPEHTLINIENYTYEDLYGKYQLNPRKWVEELRHRIFLTERGITKIIKY